MSKCWLKQAIREKNKGLQKRRGLRGRDFTRIKAHALDTIQWHHLQITILFCQISFFFSWNSHSHFVKNCNGYATAVTEVNTCTGPLLLSHLAGCLIKSLANIHCFKVGDRLFRDAITADPATSAWHIVPPPPADVNSCRWLDVFFFCYRLQRWSMTV